LEIEHLRLQVARPRRLKFGESSERFVVDLEHTSCRLGETKAAAACEPVTAVTKNEPPSRKQPVREALPC